MMGAGRETGARIGGAVKAPATTPTTASLWASLEQPWRECLREAWEAYKAGAYPFGAVVVDPQGQVVARGRNRIRHEAPNPLAHAELDALMTFDYTHLNPRPCTLYALVEPCPLCMGALYMSGVRRLKFACRDPVAGSSNMLGTTPYLSRKPVVATGPGTAEVAVAAIAAGVAGAAGPAPGGPGRSEGAPAARTEADLEAITAAIHIEFALHDGFNRVQEFVEQWRKVIPRGVRLGEALFESGELRGLAAAGASAGEVVDRLAAALVRSR